MNQIVMAVHALFFVARTSIDHRTVCQHGTALVRHGQQISMALLALGVIKGVVGSLPVFLTIVFFYYEMLNDVLDTMIGFGKEEVECLVRSRQVTVHAVGHESLGIVDMGGRSPGNHRRLDLMAHGAKFRSGGAYHGIIGHAEQGKRDENADANKDRANQILLHGFSPIFGWFRFFSRSLYECYPNTFTVLLTVLNQCKQTVHLNAILSRQAESVFRTMAIPKCGSRRISLPSLLFVIEKFDM